MCALLIRKHSSMLIPKRTCLIKPRISCSQLNTKFKRNSTYPIHNVAGEDCRVPSARLVCVELNPGPNTRRGRRANARIHSIPRSLSNAFTSSVGRTGPVITRKLSSDFFMNSSAGGVINNLASLAPNTYTDWSALSSLYDEFRVIGAKIRLFPMFPNSTTLLNNVLVICYDNDDASNVLGGFTDGTDYSISKVAPVINSTGAPITLTAQVSFTANNGNWFTTGTANAYPHSFKTYADALTVSTAYFHVFIELIIQLRGST